MLVDVVEEEYRHETIPHLYGPDRRAVLERKLAWFFRGTPYSHVLPEGRETEGRRDDKVLLSAITNPELVQPWTRLCVQQKVPVAGIYSLAIVSTALLDRINVKSPNVLMGQHADPQRSPAILFPGGTHQDQPAGEDAAARHGALRPVYPE